MNIRLKHKKKDKDIHTLDIKLIYVHVLRGKKVFVLILNQSHRTF